MLFPKFNLTKNSGEPVDPKAKYYVIRYDADAEDGHLNRCILIEYVRAIRGLHTDLADTLEMDVLSEEGKFWKALDEFNLQHTQE